MSRKRPPSFDFYPDDFVGGTLGMHPTARGIYITLLCHQWSHGSIPNPTNIRQFVQITGAMPDELSEHLPEVLEKFEQDDLGRMVNMRLLREYDRKMRVLETWQKNGKRGGRPRVNQADDPGDNQRVNQADNPLGNPKKTKRGSRKKEEGSNQKKNVSSFDPTALPLPFSSDAFAAAWSAFCQMRTEIRKPIGQTGSEASLRKLAAMGEERAIAALEHTTANEWQGIREPDGPRQANAAKTFAQQRVENTRRAIEDFANG